MTTRHDLATVTNAEWVVILISVCAILGILWRRPRGTRLAFFVFAATVGMTGAYCQRNDLSLGLSIALLVLAATIGSGLAVGIMRFRYWKHGRKPVAPRDQPSSRE
jgi:hypothetical protein